LLTEQQEYAVRNLLERLQALLATATKKRPLNPPNLLIGKSGKANGQITSAAEVKAKLKHVSHSLFKTNKQTKCETFIIIERQIKAQFH